MFTGLVEKTTDIIQVERKEFGFDIVIDLGELIEESKIGDSIAVSGICMTITSIKSSIAVFYCSNETIKKTIVSSWKSGTKVNLERALRLGDRLGGHIVSGHVDGVGRLLKRINKGESEEFVFVLPSDKSVKAVEKGSITIDGISLTTFNVRGNEFTVALIPHTIKNTTLENIRPSMQVNLEQDMISRWVEKLICL